MDQIDLKRRPRILLADDSVTIRKVIELTFADEGIDVTSVADGDEAMRSFVEDQPDLLIADVNMPGISGYTLCEMIKLDETTRDIPVVLLTGSFEPFDAGEASRVGANYYFTKPFSSIREVVEKVSDLLDNRSFDVAMMHDTADIDDLYVESVYAKVDEPVEIESSTVSDDLEAEAANDFAELAFLDEIEQPKLDVEESDEPIAEFSAIEIESVEVSADPYADTLEQIVTDPFERIVDDEPIDAVAEPAEIEVVSVDADIGYLNRAADAADASIATVGSFQRIFDDAEFDDELIEEFRPNYIPEPDATVDTAPEIVEAPITSSSIDPFAATATMSPIPTQESESTLLKFEIEDSEPKKSESTYSPELVDAIVDRLMERLSDKAVREAAQEAVPRIAEKLIREALDTETNS